MACLVEGCDRDASKKGLCRRHYYRLLTYGDPIAGGPLRNTVHSAVCSVIGCDKPYLAQGLCDKHYAVRRAHGDPLYQRKLKRDQPCAVRGCKQTAKGRGYCGKHYQRLMIHGDPLVTLTGEVGRGGLDAKGYIVRGAVGHPNADKNGKIKEHRLVMAEMLGRPLFPDETVHHKNGVRTDNRPENLELWTGNHQPGQRVEDLVLWAKEILGRYEPDALNAPIGHAEDCGRGRSIRCVGC